MNRSSTLHIHSNKSGRMLTHVNISFPFLSILPWNYGHCCMHASYASVHHDIIFRHSLIV